MRIPVRLATYEGEHQYASEAKREAQIWLKEIADGPAPTPQPPGTNGEDFWARWTPWARTAIRA
jgi:hypothetical protein